jgi:hypothetical protein
MLLQNALDKINGKIGRERKKLTTSKVTGPSSKTVMLYQHNVIF